MTEPRKPRPDSDRSPESPPVELLTTFPSEPRATKPVKEGRLPPLTSVRGKVLLLVASVTVLFMLGLGAWLAVDIWRGERMERDEVVETKAHFKQLDELYSSTMDALVRDYTFWDEMVTAVARRDRRWAATHVPEALDIYQVSAAWMYNIDADLVYGADRHLGGRLARFTFPSQVIRAKLTRERFCQFAYETPAGIILVRGATIHASADAARKGKVHGYFFAARLIDDAYLDRLEEVTKYGISLVARGAESPKLSPSMAKHTIASEIPILGWDGIPLGRFRVQRESAALKTLQSASVGMFQILVAFAFSMASFLAYFMYRWVAAPLRAVTAAIRSESPEPIAGMLDEQTEFGELARVVDRFFEQRGRLTHEMRERKRAEEELWEYAHGLEETRRELEVKTVELARARDGAVSSTAAKSDFLAHMSHELRTPMNGVMGTLELLQDTHLDEEQLEYVVTARRSADTLISILNDVLDFSKIEAGKLQIEKVEMALREALDEAVDLLAPRAKQKGVELIVQYSPDLPTTILGDALRIRQIVMNLLSNAIKFTSRGHVMLRAEIKRRSQTEVTIILKVEDTGIGIPPERLSAIFQSYDQADASTARRFGGTGLGLSICKRLAELMGGDIGATSEVGKGSCFSVSFPAIAPLQATDADVTGDPALEDMLVLIAHENQTSRRVILEMLTGWSMCPSSAANLEDALKSLERSSAAGRPFEVALIDEHLIRTDHGERFLSAIRLDSAHRKTTFVLLTATARSGEIERWCSQGFAVHLARPIRPHSLLRLLGQIRAGEVVTRIAEAEKASRQVQVIGMGPASDDINLNLESSSPLITPAVPEEPERSEARETADASPKSGGPAAPALDPAVAPRVMVAEDNSVNQVLARMLLERMGCLVTLVENGQAALDARPNAGYDMILMDCQMPIMDGYEATAAIRKWEAENNSTRMPIVAMTAHAMPGDREKCEASGMDDYLTKPILAPSLREAVAKWTGKPVQDAPRKRRARPGV